MRKSRKTFLFFICLVKHREERLRKKTQTLVDS